MTKSVRAFIGIDAGTTGCTVMVFDEHGKSLGQGYEEYPCITPAHGWNEQDLEAVWRGICGASRKAIAMADLPKEAYRSIGFSSQRGTFAALDANKRPLGNSWVWNCGRAVEYQEIFAASITPEDHQTHTGM